MCAQNAENHQRLVYAPAGFAQLPEMVAGAPGWALRYMLPETGGGEWSTLLNVFGED